jgi:hypothetical protein
MLEAAVERFITAFYLVVTIWPKIPWSFMLFFFAGESVIVGGSVDLVGFDLAR